MGTTTDTDLIASILGEINMVKARLNGTALTHRLDSTQDYMSGVSKDGVFERDGLLEMRKRIRALRVAIDDVIPYKAPLTQGTEKK